MMNHTNRDVRLRLREEAEDFRRIFQPLSLFFGFFGLLSVIWAGGILLMEQNLRLDLLGVGVTLMSFPLLVYLFRFFRGHLRKDLYG
jgi:Na+/pantothenate symporter